MNGSGSGPLSGFWSAGGVSSAYELSNSTGAEEFNLGGLDTGGVPSREGFKPIKPEHVDEPPLKEQPSTTAM